MCGKKEYYTDKIPKFGETEQLFCTLFGLIQPIIQFCSGRSRCGAWSIAGVTTINNRLIFGSLFVSFVIYSAYVYTSGTEAAHIAPMSDEARRGQQVYQGYNCTACHQFYGLGGYMGPDLTNVISNRGVAYSSAFITAGTARMPNLGLSPDEVADVVAYLGFVDTTGTYPPENYEVTWFGTVRQEDDPQ